MQLEVFKNAGFEIRGGLLNNEPYFVLADVCKALDLSNPTMVGKSLDEDALSSTEVIDSMNRVQNVNTINESGLYQCIFQSRKPEAKQFKKWVTSEVLPSIRKHGAYATPETLENMIANPDFAISLLENLKKEQQLRKLAEIKIEKDKPLTEFGRAISSTDATVTVGVFAKTISKDLNIDFGRNKCYKWLRKNGYVFKNSTEPMQKYVNSGILDNGEHYRTSGQFSKIDTMTLITGKGQKHLFEKIKEDLEL